MKRINNGWEFVAQWDDAFARGEGEATAIRLPHTVAEMPLHYGDPASYQMICGYRRILTIPREAEGKRIFLQFDGAAHGATVFCDGVMLAEHRCGYTAFRVELTDRVEPGQQCLIAVRLDTTENPAYPPFGFVIDYLTYGGIYRDVWLDLRPQRYLEDVFVRTVDSASIFVGCQGDIGPEDRLHFSVEDGEGHRIINYKAPSGVREVQLSSAEAKVWSPKTPRLYSLRTTLYSAAGTVDELVTSFGFRTAEFKADGFYLNGEKLFLRGLNRHQSYPYLGYAVPEALQREDARILKEELCCNAVRTSHYPQSHYFIDECDRLGLLVFTEFPGWQHIGDEAWKDQACQNLREMIIQYRNHPSIVLWGVRINESLDDEPFYRRTNAIAHELDPSRATSGVRYIEKSQLLEDVYAFNDFSHKGDNPGVRPKKEVCPDPSKPLLISESNGHMYPTKPYDSWGHRQSQALRHARVLDDAMADGGHVGCFQWCMFDYGTHRDFGSGDGICYHGVMDSFRNPKLAAALYASQGDETPVLEIGSSMDIGDYPGGKVGEVSAFTNLDEVELYKDGNFVSRLVPGPWKALAHGPLRVEDTIGELLESQEGFPPPKAAAVRKILRAAREKGLDGLAVADKFQMLLTMARYHLSFDDGVALYGRYVANWGGEATAWRFDGKRDGKVVISSIKQPSTSLHLDARASHQELHEGEVYDLAAVRVRVLDDNDNLAVYAQLPVRFELEGDAELVGPDTVTAEGGSCGCYVRSCGRAGTARLRVSTDETAAVILSFTVVDQDVSRETSKASKPALPRNPQTDRKEV